MSKAGGNKISYFSDGNLQGFFKDVFKKTEDEFFSRRDNALVRFNELLLARTPVYSGDMVHNWRWSTRAPNYEHDDPIDSPPMPGYPKGTPLGDEPRRAANETRARQSLQGALRARDPESIYLTNTSEHAVEVEQGTVPSRGTPGFLRLTIKDIFG